MKKLLSILLILISLICFTQSIDTNLWLSADTTNIELYWVTSNEINNDYFTIEKSNDGINFEIVEIILGAGNSDILLEYSFVDKNPINGISYYRLKQTDFDGKFEYSDIISVGGC